MNGSHCLCAPEMTASEVSAQHRKKQAESQNRLVPVSPVLLPEDEHFIPLQRRSGEITAKFAKEMVGARVPHGGNRIGDERACGALEQELP